MQTSTKFLALALALAACDQGVPKKTEKPVVAAAATVTLTAVTFADDCGGTPPSQAPASPPPAPASVAPPARREAPSASQPPAAEAQIDPARVARRRCEQTSMQLAIAATKDTEVTVKKVEVFDEKGAFLGVLATSNPTRWADGAGAYQEWDGRVAAGQTASVSYVLQQASYMSDWSDRSRTYTVKVVASVGGIDQPLQTTVMVIAKPPPVPT